MTESVLTKIRKLLELSKSSNEHEAATAAARAAELMIKHQIEEADLEASAPGEKPDPIADEAIDEHGKWVSWKGWILMGLGAAFGGETYRRSRRLVGQQAIPGEHRFVGPKSVIEAVKYMYMYLCKEVARLADDGYRIECEEIAKSGVKGLVGFPPARSWKASFRAGAANTIWIRLAEQRKETVRVAKADNKTLALAVIDKHREATLAVARKAALWNYSKRTGERIYASTSAGSSSRSGWTSGTAAGRAVSLPGSGKQIGSGSRRIGS